MLGLEGPQESSGLCPNSSVWMWEHILQGRPERLPVRLSLAPLAAQWYSNATVRGFADIRPSELAKRTKDLRMRLDEQGYRFILNELVDRKIIWCPYQGGPDDELVAVRGAGMGCEGTRPSGDNSGEGNSTRVMSDVELALRGEVLLLSGLVRGKRGLREELRLRGAIIDALADTSERDRDLAASEAMRMRLEGELQTLRVGWTDCRRRLVASTTRRSRREMLQRHRLMTCVPSS